MQIASIAFANPAQDHVVVEADGRRLFAPWPIRSWHRELAEAWLAAGNAIAPYVEPPETVPSHVAVLQLFDELDQVHGIDLENEVQTISPKAARRLRLAQTISRQDPMVPALQAKLGWTDAQVDALFIAASKRI